MKPGSHKLSKRAASEIRKIFAYNDKCEVPTQRVTRQETVLLLEQYGWSGTVSSLNRLLKSNFNRSFTG
jgi:hypothetical protein